MEREGEWGRERPRQTDRLETDRHRQTNRDTHRGRYFASQDVSRGVLLSHPKCSVELGGATKASIVYKMQPKTCLSNVWQIVMFAHGWCVCVCVCACVCACVRTLSCVRVRG